MPKHLTQGRLHRRVIAGALTGLLIATPPLPGIAPPSATLAATRPYNATLLLSTETTARVERVATDGATIAWLTGDGAIYVRTLADGRDIRLLDGPARRSELALAGGTLVWVERAASGTIIYGLRLAGGDPFVIADGPGERNGPAISGSTVVWREARAGSWLILGYNIETRQALSITTAPERRGAVTVSDNMVAWEIYRDRHWGLITYDLQRGQEQSLTTDQSDDTSPALGQEGIVFVRRPVAQSAGSIVFRDWQGQETVIVRGHLVLQPTFAGNVIVWEDWRDGLPNLYAFDRASGKEFPLMRTEDARGPVIAGDLLAWYGRGQAGSRVTAVRLVRPLPSDPQDPPTITDADVRYFSETRHSIAGAFRQFWFLHGGLGRFGFPLTEAFEETGPDGVKRQVQYFERAKLEADPKNPKQISLGRLGADSTAGRSFPRVAPFDSSETALYFAETGHALSGWFLAYWRDNGDLALFGYPISEEITENGQRVQYFERARFELVSGGTTAQNGVVLGQLGREALIKRGWLGPNQNQPGR